MVSSERIRFAWKLWRKSPVAAFFGMRLIGSGGLGTLTVIPYNWRTRNPFGTMHVAAMMVGGEAVGAIQLLKELEQVPGVRAVIKNIEATYIAPARADVIFTLASADRIYEALRGKVKAGPFRESCHVKAYGYCDGIRVCEVTVEWKLLGNIL